MHKTGTQGMTNPKRGEIWLVQLDLVLASWVMAIAILSVQNAALVSLNLTFESIQLPVGLVLAFSAVVGIMGMALVQPLWSLVGSGQSNSESENDLDEEDFS